MENQNQKSAPTGCYKCGRPGHWSRDCPSSAPNPNSNPYPNPNRPSSSSFPKPTQNSFRTSAPTSSKGNPGSADGPASAAKAKKAVAPRTRPKLTPQLLLSDDGLGYVLRHFPRNFKYRGRGHEVSDLGNLISMYAEWHSRLLPYYSFDQFVHKVEQVAATKRVKSCLRELRERVAKGGDPTKLHEPPAEDGPPQDGQEARTFNEVGLNQDAPSSKNHNVDDVQEDMLQDIYENAIEQPSGNSGNDVAATKELPDQISNERVSRSNENDITEQQRARMEANRLKALEKATARARALQAT